MYPAAFPCCCSAPQAEIAAAANQERLSSLAKEVESKSAADSDALRRLQETLAAQQEDVQK